MHQRVDSTPRTATQLNMKLTDDDKLGGAADTKDRKIIQKGEMDGDQPNKIMVRKTQAERSGDKSSGVQRITRKKKPEKPEC